MYISVGLVGLGKRRDWLWLSLSCCLCFCDEIWASWTSLVDSVSFREQSSLEQKKEFSGLLT